MPLILKAFGTVSLVAAYSAVLGYLLLGSACLAVGTWISALTENQILAYLATFGALLVAYIMDGIQTMFTTGNLLAFIAFMVVVLIASILVGSPAGPRPCRKRCATPCCTRQARSASLV